MGIRDLTAAFVKEDLEDAATMLRVLWTGEHDHGTNVVAWAADVRKQTELIRKIVDACEDQAKADLWNAID